MAIMEARIRLVLAETLLAFGRDTEAEAEILAALPTIQEGKLRPEGVGALFLLRESVRRRKTDSKALRQVLQHVQKGALR